MLSEFLTTNTGLPLKPNCRHRINIAALTRKILQPTRDYYNIAMLILSGFRSTAVNNIVGGSPTSQHLDGAAADFTLAKPEILWDCFIWIATNLDFGQLIYYDNKRFIHVSLGTKKQVFINSSGVLYPMGKLLGGVNG